MAARVLTTFVCVLLIFTDASFAGFPYKEGTFTQFVDHYNLMSYGDQTFSQRYLYQDEHWGGDGYPIFFYAGNEGAIETFWDASGFVHEIAPQFKAYVVFPEHRYYGKSLPFGEDSFTAPHLGLLSLTQAVADYAVLLSDLKDKLKAPNSRIIAFGGSYGGVLAAYMRFKHPNIVYGALAASAPVLMQDPNGPHDFFFHRVTKDFRDISESCYDRVRLGFSQQLELFHHGHAEILARKMSLCKPPKTEADFLLLQMWARNAFVMMAMLDYPYPTDFMGKLPGNPVKVGCEAIMSQTDALVGMADLVGVWYNATGKLQCFDVSKEFIPCADPTGCGVGPDSIAWDYQMCTDLAQPTGSDNVTDMFPVMPMTPEIRTEYCQKKFGVTPRPFWPVEEFFGRDLNGTSRIIFSNGDLDPWMGGGITHDLSDTIKFVLVKGGAHHLDLRNSNKLDPPGVITAREIEKNIIQNWLRQ